MRGVLVLIIGVVAVGCAAGGDVVEEPDEDRLRALMTYEVHEEELRFDAAGTEVHATLTLPEDATGVPAVVLVAGSGPTDRDWNNPLLPGTHGAAIELAEGLSKTGVAVLRYDKRGSGETPLDGSVRWSDYLEELEAAVETVKDRDEVDETRVFVAGHSEGGTHALRAVADGRVDVAGAVLMATSGRTMRELVRSRIEEQLRMVGVDDERIDAELAGVEGAMDAIKAGDDVDPAEITEIDGIASLIQTLRDEQTRQFATQMLDWNPLEAIRRVNRPVLIVNGVADTQIDVEEDARALYDAARNAEVDAQLAIVDRADHVLKYQPEDPEHVGPEHTLTYNDPARRLNRGALEALAVWVHGD